MIYLILLSFALVTISEEDGVPYEEQTIVDHSSSEISTEDCAVLLEAVRKELENHISAFCGNSGVGKSSLLNAIFPSLELKIGEISDKLGRGRHTTRHSELFPVAGGYVADTPGFSSLDFEENEIILKDELPYAFREFEQYLGQCRFTSCLHTKEKGCRIIQAVEDGEIPASRHESYCAMMEQAKEVKR